MLESYIIPKPEDGFIRPCWASAVAFIHLKFRAALLERSLWSPAHEFHKRFIAVWVSALASSWGVAISRREVLDPHFWLWCSYRLPRCSKSLLQAAAQNLPGSDLCAIHVCWSVLANWDHKGCWANTRCSVSFESMANLAPPIVVGIPSSTLT